LEIIKRSLAGGDDFLISGFGKFTVRQKDARRGKNPATGEDLRSILPLISIVTKLSI